MSSNFCTRDNIRFIGVAHYQRTYFSYTKLQFLGAFAKLRKASISFVMSVYPHETTRFPVDWFWLNLTFELFFEKLSRKFNFHSNPTRIMGTLHEHVFILMTISRWILPRMRSISNKIVEKIKTHILCSLTVFRKSRHLWDNVKNVVQPDKPHLTI